MELPLPITDPIYQFTTVVLAALFVQLALERSRIPGIVGLLLVGMLLGPGGSGVLSDKPVPELLGSVGLLHIMFLAGAELDLKAVQRRKREVAAFGLMGFGFPFLLIVSAGLTFGLSWPGALLLGAALASHTLLSFPMIVRLQLVHRPAVATAVGGTLLADIGALVLLVVIITINDADAQRGGWFLPLGLLAVMAVASIWSIPPLARSIIHSDVPTVAEKGLLLLAILLGLATLAGLIGTEEILGAFLAGLCVNRLLQDQDDLRNRLSFAGRMIFIPFFFVDTGMRLEWSAFAEAKTWVLAPFWQQA